MKMLAAASVALCAVAWARLVARRWPTPSSATSPARWRASRPAPTSTRPRPRALSCSIRPIPSRARSSCWPPSTRSFPKIKTNYVRLQAGALYAKVLSERQAKSYLVDVIQISDMGMILDFQKRGGFTPVHLARDGRLQAGVQEQARGLLDLGLGDHGRHRLQPQERVGGRRAQEVGRPARSEVEGRDQRQGLELRPAARRLVHAEADPRRWTTSRSSASQKPRAFNSYVQQYGRLVDGQDKVIMGAQYSGYIEFKAKGAPLAFVFPETGVPAVSETYGIVADGPHPNAAAAVHGLVPLAGRPAGAGRGAAAALAARRRAGAGRQRAAQGHEAARSRPTGTPSRRTGRSSPRNGTASSARGAEPALTLLTAEALAAASQLAGDHHARHPAGRGLPRHPADGVPGRGIAQHRRSDGVSARGVRHRELPRDLRRGHQRPRQHGDHRRDGHRDGDPDRLHAGLDPDAHQRAGPRQARAADGAALLHDAAGRRAGLGGPRRPQERLRQPALARGGRQRRPGRHLLAISASPGSWRCSRAPSPSS